MSTSTPSRCCELALTLASGYPVRFELHRTGEELTFDELVRRHRFAGLKPYRSFASDPANCRIADYFPEAQMEVADHHRLAVTLHMAKFDGIADPENLADLADLTRRYPHIRWILAHCARAFNPYTLESSTQWT